jgi:hypothetical protein
MRGTGLRLAALGARRVGRRIRRELPPSADTAARVGSRVGGVPFYSTHDRDWAHVADQVLRRRLRSASSGPASVWPGFIESPMVSSTAGVVVCSRRRRSRRGRRARRLPGTLSPSSAVLGPSAALSLHDLNTCAWLLRRARRRCRTALRARSPWTSVALTAVLVPSRVAFPARGSRALGNRTPIDGPLFVQREWPETRRVHAADRFSGGDDRLDVVPGTTSALLGRRAATHRLFVPANDRCRECRVARGRPVWAAGAVACAGGEAPARPRRLADLPPYRNRCSSR